MQPLPRPKFAGRIVKEFPVPLKKVTECECDRCHRKWWVEGDPKTPRVRGQLFIPEGEEPDGEPPEGGALLPGVVLGLGGVTYEIDFEVLCASCTRTVRNYIAGILRIKSDLDKMLDSEAKEEGAETPSLDDSEITTIEDPSAHDGSRPARPAARSPSSSP